MTSNRLRGLAAGLAVVILACAAGTEAVKAAQKGDRKAGFEVYRDSKEEWRWRFKAANGEVIATPGQGYKGRTDAMKAIESLQKGEKLKVEFYEDKKDEHRWRVKASNGNIMAVSSEGYKTKAAAEKGYDVFKTGAKSGKVELVDK